MVVGILAPVSGFAILNNANNTSTQAQTGKLSCERILALYSNVTQKFVSQETKITQKRGEITSSIQQRWEERDVKLENVRDKWSKNRQEQFKKLEEKFQGDTQKQALIVFETAVSAAISARKTAIDAAIATYRQGVEQIKSDRQVKIDAAKTAYKNAVNAAYEKAKTDCANGVNTTTIRPNLKDAIAAAKTKYQSDYQAIEKISTTMDQFITVRNAAIKKAIQDFKAAMERARTDFKTAMGQTNNATSTSATSTEE